MNPFKTALVCGVLIVPLFTQTANAKRICTPVYTSESVCTPVKHECNKNGICKPIASTCTTKKVSTERCYDDGRK